MKPTLGLSLASLRTGVLLVLIALAAVGLARLSFDVEMLNLLPGDSQVPRGLRIYQEHFSNAGELVVTVQGSSASEAATAIQAVVEKFRSRTDLVERLFWQPPSNDSIESSAQFLAYLWLNAPPEKVRELQERLGPEKLTSELEMARERMTTSMNPRDLMLLPRDPFRLSSLQEGESDALEPPERFFSSQDGRFRILYLYSAAPLQTYEQCAAWLAQVRVAIRQALEQAGTGDVDVALTGRPVFVDEIATGMKSDLSRNAPGTLLVIGLLFYLVHREFRSLVFLLATLLIVMVWTALIGAAFLSQLNVISIGFASILLGLAEDFGIVLHQEARCHPGADAVQVRSAAGPGIFWSAITTAGAFALLNFSTLPGLRQLGTLVALGILLGAWVMSFLFLPLLLRFARRGTVTESASSGALSAGWPLLPRVLTIVLLVASVALLFYRTPGVTASPDVLRPRKSEASRTLALVQENLGATIEPYWVFVSGQTAGEVHSALEQLVPPLEEQVSAGRISSYQLPLEIWPQEEWQQENAPILRELAARDQEFYRAAVDQGFTTNALELTSVVLNEWREPGRRFPEWPSGRIAEWLLPKFVSISPTNHIALGLLYPTETFDPDAVVPPALASKAIVSGWRLLGQEVLARVQKEIPLISLGVLLIVTAALYLTFRSWAEVARSYAVLALSGLALLAAMGVLGWNWNLINLTSLPLLLGMGIDYSIHIQLALRRLDHNATAVFQGVGRALLLAGSTSIAGFIFLGTSSNLGMASLGQVCATGLAILLIVSVFLLPGWTSKKSASGDPRPPA